MNTRGLTGLSSNRISSELITLRYAHETDLYSDGSVTITYTDLITAASVGILQPKEIERLEKGGVVIRNGITIVGHQAPSKRPDTIIYDGKHYRVLNWAFIKEYEADSFDDYDAYATDYGTVVAACDEENMTGADA